jgi:uncharacterized protein (TIGR02453 family)
LTQTKLPTKSMCVSHLQRFWRTCHHGMTFVGNEKTMFRVSRDVRFSNDKSPYSTHVSGVLTPSGTKSEASPLIYLHMEAHGGFAVAGLYHPPTDRLDALRESILENSEEFSEILNSLAESGLVLTHPKQRKTCLAHSPRSQSISWQMSSS